MATWTKQKRIDLNPSSADRWTTCTASPKFIFDNWEKIPQEENRKFADPGTTAHEVAAAMLQHRPIDLPICPVPIDKEMRWHAWNYAEFVESLIEPETDWFAMYQPGGRLLVEQKLPLFYNEGRNAIVDAAVINPTNLHIVDYKYGEGIIVSPENNLQAIIYAKLVISSPAWKDMRIWSPDHFPISITIYQPRTRNDEPFHTWGTTWGDIQEKAKEIFTIAQHILRAHQILNVLQDTKGVDPSEYTLEFKPSEKACQWCPAKGFCEARQAELTKDLEPLAVIDGRSRPLGKALSEKQLAAIVRHGAEIKKWIDDAQEFALQHMRAGGSIEGFKLVISRGGNRYWSDPSVAAKYLQQDTLLRREEIFSEKVIGPAAIEKLIGKGKFPTRVYNLIAKPPGQSVIAPLDDPREPALINAASEFTNLDEIENQT